MNNKILHLKKTINKKIAFGILLIFTVFISCDDMNTIHQKYYDWGEDIYMGVADSIEGLGGYEKAQFHWELNADPRITETVIFWNQKADSVVIDVNRTESGRLHRTYDLDNLEEGSYIFEFVTRDNKGHFSLPREVIVEVYGERYSNNLRNRVISSIAHLEDGSMNVEWDPIASSAIQYVTIKYETDGQEQSVRVENDDTSTILHGLKTGDVIRISTAYLPEHSLDILYATDFEYTMPAFEREIDKSKFSILPLFNDNITVLSDGRNLSKIWDGSYRNPGILHTIENAPGFDFPHHFTFDMNVLAKLSRFRLWPRVDAGSFSGHSPRFFEIWGTDELKNEINDQNYWSSDAWREDWNLIGDHEIVRPAVDQSTAWSNGWEYSVDGSIEKVRYIRLIIKNENWQKTNCVNIGEITLWGDDL